MVGMGRERPCAPVGGMCSGRHGGKIGGMNLEMNHIQLAMSALTNRRPIIEGVVRVHSSTHPVVKREHPHVASQTLRDVKHLLDP